MVVFEALTCEKTAKDPTQIGISRGLAKVDRMDMVEISRKFPGKVPAQDVCSNLLLLLEDKVLILRLIRGIKTLPRKRTSKKVEKHIS